MAPLLVRVRSRMFIRANRKVLGLLDGQYMSLARGRSLDFEDLRAYDDADDIKDIDWKATARHGHPLVRTYAAHQQHELVLVVDTGRNLAATTAAGGPKREVAVLVAGVLGFLALRHGDRVSLVHGNAAGAARSRPASTEGRLEGHLRTIDTAASLTGPHSDLLALLRFTLRSLKRRSLVVIIADDTELSPALEEATRLLHARHELLWCSMTDAHLVEGVGSGRAMVDIDESWEIPEFLRGNRRLRADFDAASRVRDDRLRKALDGMGIGHVRVSEPSTVVSDLLAMLGRRTHARRR